MRLMMMYVVATKETCHARGSGVPLSLLNTWYWKRLVGPRNSRLEEPAWNGCRGIRCTKSCPVVSAERFSESFAKCSTNNVAYVNCLKMIVRRIP